MSLTNQLKSVWFPTTYINETKIKVESQYNNMGIEVDYGTSLWLVSDDSCWAQWKAPMEETTRDFWKESTRMSEKFVGYQFVLVLK